MQSMTFPGRPRDFVAGYQERAHVLVDHLVQFSTGEANVGSLALQPCVRRAGSATLRPSKGSVKATQGKTGEVLFL